MIKELGKGKARLIVNIGSGENRTRRTKTVEYKTKRELKKMYDEFEAEVRKAPPSGMTVKSIVSGYIAKKKALGASANTIRGYNICAERIYSVLGEFSAESLTTYHVEEFVALLADKSGKAYSPKTIANTIGLLSSAYEDAERTGRLERNPCSRATLPKKESREIVVFNEDEMMKFLEVLRNERIDYMVGYELCLLCGLRRSEVLGLKEEDVDIENRTVSIQRSRHYVEGKSVEQTTKTAKSRRTLALPDVLVKDLAMLLKERHEFDHVQSEYLIQDGFGGAINPSAFSSQVIRIEEKAGLPHVSVHGLRHTYASMLNSAQIDIARISAELGHSNITTTLNIYTHVFGGASASSRGIADTINSKLEKDKNDKEDDEENEE